MKQVALVTGGTQRIGRVIAETLVRSGWAVAIHCRRVTAAAEEVVAALNQQGGRAVLVDADLQHEDEVSTIVTRAVAAVGPLGCVINNAASFAYDSALTVTRASWDAHMETNLRAPYVITQAFARQLPQASNGVVINIIDQRVLRLTPHFISYTLSKAGLWTLTQTLAQALAPRIRVNAIGPGPVLPSSRQTAAQFAAQVAETPLQRESAPEHIAQTVMYLIGASTVTGQLICVDSGQHLGPSAAQQPHRE